MKLISVSYLTAVDIFSWLSVFVAIINYNKILFVLRELKLTPHTPI
jgi:hypothetical protein